MNEDFILALSAELKPEKVRLAVKKALDAVPQSAKTVQVEIKGNNAFLKTTEQQGNKLNTTLQKINVETGKVTTVFDRNKISADNMSKSISTASKHTKTLGEDFVSTLGKVAKFGAVTSLIGLFTKGMYEAVEVVKEFDSAMTEFKKVSDLSGDSLDSYNKKLSDIGDEVARTTTEMIQASTEFVKAGYTEEQSANLAKVASLYQNVADSQIDAGTASSFIISQLKAFNMTADDATTVIDMLNEVSNRFSVSSTDIASGMTKSSSALSTYGNTMSESISLITAGTEIMTGQASKVSKGLRSIGANIVKLADDTGVLEYSVNGVTKSLSLFDEQGKALSTFDVLSEVAKDWDNMSQAEQSNLALAQAG